MELVVPAIAPEWLDNCFSLKFGFLQVSKSERGILIFTVPLAMTSLIGSLELVAMESIRIGVVISSGPATKLSLSSS